MKTSKAVRGPKRFNKFGKPDPNGRYEKHDGVWWFYFGVAKPNRTRVTTRHCEECGVAYFDMGQRTRTKCGKWFCSTRCAGKWSVRHKITPVGQRGSVAPRWNGGVCYSPEGYANVWMPDHPSLKGTTRKYVRRCRLVMEKILGRPLMAWEQVHHKNNKKADDRPENLELWIISHPAGTNDLYCPRCDCESCKSKRT